MPQVICDVCKCEFRPDKNGNCANCGSKLPAQKNDEKKTVQGDETTRTANTRYQQEGREDHCRFETEKDIHGERIRLEYKHPVLKSGQKLGRLPLKFINQGKSSVKEINLSVKSDAFESGVPEKRLTHTINAGCSTRNLPCTFKLINGYGTSDVEVVLSCTDTENTVKVYSGRLAVHIRDASLKGPAIQLENNYGSDIDIDYEASSIAVKEMYGTNVNIRYKDQVLFDDESGWIKVPLEFDHEKTEVMNAALRKENTRDRPFKSLGPDPIAPVNSIDPVDQWKIKAGKSKTVKAFLLCKTGSTERVVCLWSGEKCRFGKSSDLSDIVALKMPDNKENRELNRRISRTHGHIRVENFRDAVIKDSSSYGIFLNGSRISKTAKLHSGDVISLSDILSFRYFAFRDINSVEEINQKFRNCQTVVDCFSKLSSINMEDVREKGLLDTILLKRTDRYKANLEYVLILKSAVIGSSITSPVQIFHKTVSSRHARILNHNSRYYVEDLGSEKGTFVNGEQLGINNRWELRTDDLIGIGDVTVKFRYLV